MSRLYTAVLALVDSVDPCILWPLQRKCIGNGNSRGVGDRLIAAAAENELPLVNNPFISVLPHKK